MRIAVIGAGNVGSALGPGWLKAGHQVIYGVRDPHSPKALKTHELVPGASLKSIAGAAAGAEALVITTPPEAVPALIPELGDLRGKVLIDATNAIRAKPLPYPTAYHALADKSGTPDVVKCFNTTGFENMLNPVYERKEPVPLRTGIDMFMAGDSVRAKEVAAALASDLGFGHCYDFGGSDRVELLEQLALCWINLAIFQGHGRDLAFVLLRR
jgi:8-hydroxy-5-deazaflavin:NADPH oxidoreductase